jgi:hypothetical protein
MSVRGRKCTLFAKVLNSVFFMLFSFMLLSVCFKGFTMFISLDLDMHSSLSSRGVGITFTSWNVRGLGHSIKTAKVFSHLKSLAADIIFLQETHIKPTRAKLRRCSSQSNFPVHNFQ